MPRPPKLQPRFGNERLSQKKASTKASGSKRRPTDTHLHTKDRRGWEEMISGRLRSLNKALRTRSAHAHPAVCPAPLRHTKFERMRTSKIRALSRRQLIARMRSGSTLFINWPWFFSALAPFCNSYAWRLSGLIVVLVRMRLPPNRSLDVPA